jgi:multidrug efflux pump subunit AcrB
MFANYDLIPAGCSQPLIKPRTIDDVPILALTLHSERYDHFMLRRVAAELDDAIKQVMDVSATALIGGQRRQVRVLLDSAKLTAYGLDPLQAGRALQSANQQSKAGSFSSGNREILVETGGFLKDAEDVNAVVLGVHDGRPVYVRDVAAVLDGPEEPANYVLFGAGPDANPKSEAPAVTITISKRKGTNAIRVAERVLAKVDSLKGRLIPNDVTVTITRHYGLTASEKSNELLFHMAIAVFGVSVLIGLVLGWREAGVVGLAIPVTLALTLATFYFLGFTLNRITLFALIFSIGILVDDPIVDVENIERHVHLPKNKGRPLRDVEIGRAHV